MQYIVWLAVKLLGGSNGGPASRALGHSARGSVPPGGRQVRGGKGSTSAPLGSLGNVDFSWISYGFHRDFIGFHRVLGAFGRGKAEFLRCFRRFGSGLLVGCVTLQLRGPFTSFLKKCGRKRWNMYDRRSICHWVGFIPKVVGL